MHSKNIERTHPQLSYHVCVGSHYLRVGRKASRKKKKSKIQIKQTLEIVQITRELMSIRNYLLQRKQILKYM